MVHHWRFSGSDFCFLLYYDMVRYGPRLSYTYFSTTEFTFKYFGFEWVQPLPSALLIGLFVVLAILALCVMLGFYYRLSIIDWSIYAGLYLHFSVRPGLLPEPLLYGHSLLSTLVCCTGT